MKNSLTILTWNVNGLRAIERKNHWPELLAHDADIICINETKSEAPQLSSALRAPKDYHARFWSSQERKGYAGTAIYIKKSLIGDTTRNDTNHETFPAPGTTVPWGQGTITYGLPNAPELDHQGRLMTLQLPNLIVVAGYFPNGGRKQERLPYKLQFYDATLDHIETLDETGLPVVLCGDINVAHTPIDLARPKQNEGRTGFLPQERAWIDELIEHDWTDVWRHHNPTTTDVYTYWDTITRARDRNVGWRIDYFFANQNALQKISKITTLTNQMGSDHCPVAIEIKP